MNELINLDNVMAVLEDYAIAVRNKYQDNLILHDRIASGELLNSVEYRVVQDGQTFEVQLTLQDYWKYIEDGTRPHFPPLDRILEWIRVKPVIPRPDDKGRIPTPQQLAYLIGRKINEEGTEGSKDLHDALEVINAEYRERIAAALGHDMQNYIRRIIVGNQ